MLHAPNFETKLIGKKLLFSITKQYARLFRLHDWLVGIYKIHRKSNKAI